MEDQVADEYAESHRDQIEALGSGAIRALFKERSPTSEITEDFPQHHKQAAAQAASGASSTRAPWISPESILTAESSDFDAEVTTFQSVVQNKDLGAIVVSFLPLADVAIIVLCLDRNLHDIARRQIDAMWPTLRPLLEPPFSLSRCDILPKRTLTLDRKSIGDLELTALAEACTGGALAQLKELQLSRNPIGNEGASALAKAIASGALAHLAFLNLCSNRIGSSGVSALAGSFASRALAQLETLSLADNQITDGGASSLADSFAKGALALLEKLLLGWNQIGNDGASALAGCFASGALAHLKTLDLNGNEIGGCGASALADSFASGALAQLNTLYMDDGPLGNEHPKLEAACLKRGIRLE